MISVRFAALLALACSVAAPALATPATLQVSSPDMPAGAAIPELFTGKDFGCTGGEISPAVAWSGAPKGTASFLVTLYDPYRPPQSGWWHWIVAGIPAQATGLARGAGNPGGPLPTGAHQVRPDGDAAEPRYYGPCPDKGDPPHRYVLTVYALDVADLNLPATATAAAWDYATLGHVLAKGQIVRAYSRP